MARKSVVLPFKAVDGGDMSSDITGTATDVTYLDNVGYQVIFTGTPTGTFSVEGTIDGENWTALSIRDADNLEPSASGSAGSLMINLNQIPYRSVRPVYTATSGSGSLTIIVLCKTVGA